MTSSTNHSMMKFSNADNYQINKALFIAGWKVWSKRFASDNAFSDGGNWKSAPMPLGSSKDSLSDLIRDGQRFSLEVMCRMMVPWSFRNQQQTDQQFLEDYKFLVQVSSASVDGNADVLVARLTDKALVVWDSMSFAEQDDYMAYAEARVQADIEVISDDPVVLDDQGIELIGEDTYPPYIPAQDASDIDFVRALVAWIEDAPFQAYYLKQAVGDSVGSWHDRQLAFFWPKPRINYQLHNATLNPLYYRANQLAKTLDKGEKWDDEWRDMAVKTAHELFQVSGTPQKDVTIENVESVIQAAVNADDGSTAKMNSGWSYLASVSTAHLEGTVGRLPLVCWNSRIASAVISRLDFLLAESGHTDLGDRFPGIGTIPGWGGTRPRQYTLDWPNGYRSWQTQVAASRLVNQMVYILNTERKESGEAKYRAMPLPGGAKGPWTVRGVQGVLFGDGY